MVSENQSESWLGHMLDNMLGHKLDPKLDDTNMLDHMLEDNKLDLLLAGNNRMGMELVPGLAAHNMLV